jgi:tetratricopeptide (TPR) repeat protein
MDDLSQAFVRAVDLHRKGDVAAAEGLYLQVLAERPDHFDGLQMLGILRYQQKRLPEALSLLGAALESKPDFPPVLMYYGLVLDALDRRKEALASYDQALALAPNYAEALYNRGLLLRRLARPAEALASFDQALSIKPDYVEAHFNRGNVLQDLERPADAVASFELTLGLRPHHVGALNNRGLALLRQHRPVEALASFERALAVQPDHARALNNRGNTLQELQRPAEALASYERALAIRPGYVEALYNRGTVLRALRRPVEALASFDQALAIDAGHVDALNNRGIVLRDLDRPHEALTSYDRALALDPGYAEAHSNRSCLALLLGDFERGWEEFEWRWRVPEIAHWRRDFAQPLWRGDTSLEGRTILLHAEQGFGDAIQFVRYVPLVAARGAKVVLEVAPALKALLSRCTGAALVVGRGEELPAFDCHCPLLSLPLAFKTRLDTIPAAIPYLSASPDRLLKWGPRLPQGGQRRVGIAWAGNADFKGDQTRSIGLTRLSPLLAVAGIQLVSLQKDMREGDRDILRSHPQVVHLGDAIEDFADTAAIMSELDLVISSDTSVVHLAGALGRPVWVLLQCVADWRWLRERSDNPWYPTARLFRQPRIDDWESVVGQVDQELARMRAGAATALGPG